MSELITVRGFVASAVREDKTHGGDAVASFRMGATERRYNRGNNTWEDGDTNWFSVACFRGLARNVAFSVQKGEKVIVSGRLKIRNWSLPDGRSGTTADIDAETVGHDLMWGLSKYKRVTKDDPAPWNSQPHQSGDTEHDHSGVDTETGELPDAAEPEDTELRSSGNAASDTSSLAGGSEWSASTAEGGDDDEETDGASTRDGAYAA